VYAWVVVISLLFIVVALVTCMEIKLNCEACKFADKGVCQRKPIPVVVEGKNCMFFIKRRMK
jgi:hypothetical protein